MRRIVPTILLILVIQPAALGDERATKPDDDLSRHVARLVAQLNDDRGVRRDAAEKQLLELAGNSPLEADRFLALLPEINPQMPPALRERLSRIRRTVEERTAKSAVAPTIVTLTADRTPLAEVFAAIRKQTGNQLKDNRQLDPDEAAAAGRITIQLKDERFWPALDKILDQANLGIYSYGGEDALAIVARDPDDGPRFNRAAYVGPFRLEILEVQAQRNERQPRRATLKLQLEVAWEPRLRPIALSQPMADVHATDERGQPIAVSQPAAVLDVEVPTGTQAAEIVLPLALPPRSATKIAALSGRMIALVPGRQEKFRFRDLLKAAGTSQRRGGVVVAVDDVRRNNEVWEVHMRMKLDDDNHALESHRGWVFQNLCYLEGKNGEPIDNAGFETTRQTPNEVGLAYFFDVPDGIEGMTWVYETPASIVELPLKYELNDVVLP